MKTYERAVRYALYPNELGLCGPRGAKERGQLYQYLTTKTKVSDSRIRELLERFWASAAYLKLIAQSNEIDDWLDPRVVEAYWIGNDLLKRVRPEDLRETVKSFSGLGTMTAKAAEELAGRIPHQARPHHSFHVFLVGSITGKVERGTIGQELCRIGWGVVEAIHDFGRQLIVQTRVLKKHGGNIYPELEPQPSPEGIKCDPRLFPRLRVGDWITYHWDRAVEIVDFKTVRQLEEWTEKILALCR